VHYYTPSFEYTVSETRNGMKIRMEIHFRVYHVFDPQIGRKESSWGPNLESLEIPYTLL